MRVAVLAHPTAAMPSAVFFASNARELRLRLSGHHGQRVIAVEVNIPPRPAEWHVVNPLRDGRPLVTHYLVINRGLASVHDADTIWAAANATADYAREQAASISALRGWVERASCQGGQARPS